MKKIFQYSLGLVSMAFMVTSCQKMDKPGLGNYPQDENPPGGPLKFYVAFDGNSTNQLKNSADSIRANFPSVTGEVVDGGASGRAYQGSPTSFVNFGSPNDWAGSTSFTVAFWVKKTPQAAGQGTNYAFALASSGYSWTNLKVFFEFEDAGNPSTTDAAAGKFYLMDQWFEYTGAKRMPNVLDGTWHHLAFVYDETTSYLYTYIDGQAPTNLPAGFGNVTKNGAPRGPLNLVEDGIGISGFVIGGPGQPAHDANTWMGNLDGQMDQFRLYGKALSASEVQALYISRL